MLSLIGYTVTNWYNVYYCLFCIHLLLAFSEIAKSLIGNTLKLICIQCANIFAAQAIAEVSHLYHVIFTH